MIWKQATSNTKFGYPELRDLPSREQEKLQWLAEVRENREAYDKAYGPGAFSKMKRHEFILENLALRAANNKAHAAHCGVKELENKLYQLTSAADYAQRIEGVRLSELAEAQKRAAEATTAREAPDARLARERPGIEKALAAAAKRAQEADERAAKVELGVGREFDEIEAQVARQKAELETRRLADLAAEEGRRSLEAARAAVQEREAREAEERHYLELGEGHPGVFARIGAALGLAPEPPQEEPAGPDSRPREVGGAVVDLGDKPTRSKRNRDF